MYHLLYFNGRASHFEMQPPVLHPVYLQDVLEISAKHLSYVPKPNACQSSCRQQDDQHVISGVPKVEVSLGFQDSTPSTLKIGSSLTGKV